MNFFKHILQSGYLIQSRWKTSLVFLLALMGTILVSQNCVKDLPDAVTKKTSSSTSTNNSAFPYEVSVDTYAYLSCSSMSAWNSRAYFTFRLMANTPYSGLGFRTAFYSSYLANKTQWQIKDYIYAQQSYRDLNIQISLKSLPTAATSAPVGLNNASSVGYVWIESAGAARLGYDPILTPLSATGYNGRFQAVYQERLIADLDLNGSSQEEQIRVAVSDQDAANGLALGFHPTWLGSDSVLAGSALMEGGSSQTAYGRGFKSNFWYARRFAGVGTDGEVLHAYNPPRVLRLVQEYQLASFPQQINTWNCPTNQQFKVVPRALWAEANCIDPNDDNALWAARNSSTDNTFVYDQANAILNAYDNYWKIDAQNRCIFPPEDGSSCYGTSAANQIDFVGDVACGGVNQKKCAHYFSFCYQNGTR